MKSDLKNWQRVVVMVGIVVGLTTVTVPRAFAEGQKLCEPSRIFLSDQSVLGMTYGDWSAAWWQYVLSISMISNPCLDTTGKNCSVGQHPDLFSSSSARHQPIL